MSIKPHKGGRTVRLSGIRITEEIKRMLDKKVKISGLNRTDAIIEALKRWCPKAKTESR